MGQSVPPRPPGTGCWLEGNRLPGGGLHQGGYPFVLHCPQGVLVWVRGEGRAEARDLLCPTWAGGREGQPWEGGGLLASAGELAV